MASRVTVVCCALTGVVLAEPPKGMRPELPSTGIRPAQYRDSRDRLRSLSDLTQVKNATLESESAFFDRLAKQKRIDDVRLDARSAAGDLKGVRNRFSTAEAILLEQADELLGRVTEPLDEGGKSIAVAHYELRRYHEGATAEARAIAAGRLEAAPMISRIRQAMKTAEHLHRTVLLRLARAQEELESARKRVADVVENTNPDDSRRSVLLDSQQAIDAAIEGLNKTNNSVSDLITLLEATRREYLPDCAPSLCAPPTTGSASNDESAKVRDSGQGVSLRILSKSAPAIAQLDEAAKWHSNAAEAFAGARTSRESAVKYLEMADALARPGEDNLRILQTRASDLLENAEDQLLETKRLLVEDAPGETAECIQCGGIVIRTRRVVDPACTCVYANESMLKAEDMIRQAQNLAEEMGNALDQLRDQDESARRIRGSEGVLSKLARALERGEEFRNQQFDVLPGETTPRIQQEMPKRDFPPMVATYVARLSWHYPVYFEDMALERYGHHHGCFQPIVSYGKFLADLALLPYNVCLDPPCSIQYDLGLYRPGDDVPHLIYLPRPDCKAALFEAAVWTGLMFTP